MYTRKTVYIVFVFLSLSFGPLRLYGSDPVTWRDVSSSGAGEVYAPVSSFVNPAALSLSRERQLLCSYENRFLVKELSSLTACFEQPTRLVDFSVLVNYFGYDLYHEIRAGINVSKLLKPDFSLGVRVYYYGLQYVDSEDNISVVSADIGLQYIPVDNFRIGVLICNPFRVSYKQGGVEYDLPVSVEAGVEWLLSERCRIRAAAEKDTRYPVAFKSGIAYDIVAQLELRAGIRTSPFMPTCGIGVRYDCFRVDAAFSYHSVLGISPALSIGYYF